MVITQSSFREWLEEELDEDQRNEIRQHGARIGIGGLTNHSDMRALWESFDQEIWDVALGQWSLEQFVAKQEFFGPTMFQEEMIWLATEILVSEIEEEDEEDEDEEEE